MRSGGPLVVSFRRIPLFAMVYLGEVLGSGCVSGAKEV
jgi:hypothetical protein